MKKSADSTYRHLPPLDECLRSAAGQELLSRHPRQLVISALRAAFVQLRNDIQEERRGISDRKESLRQILRLAGERLSRAELKMLRPVVNATGVLLQTNLGRAPLSERAVERMNQVARGYCNLEYDLDTGERGKRGSGAEELLLRALQCAADEVRALVVNNCAAAALLALNSLAEGGEVIVSRGELVEIGGGFRVPEILRKSGARLVEVGTTNRTRVEDYAGAITAETRLILRVHRSNFQIVGFTEQPSLGELVRLGAQAAVPVFEDQGTGCMVDLSAYGLPAQPSFADSVRRGVSLVSASGDKLLGGPQCGLVVGRPGLIQKLRANPLYRAFRVDKLTLAALEATLLAYVSGEEHAIPAIRMLSLDAETVRARCERWRTELARAGVNCAVAPTESVVGGGTAPGATLSSYALALDFAELPCDEIAGRLRRMDPPTIARIHEGRVLLDLRTVPPDMDDSLIVALMREFGTANPAEPRRVDGEPSDALEPCN